jgi:hypothetical protein
LSIFSVSCVSVFGTTGSLIPILPLWYWSMEVWKMTLWNGREDCLGVCAFPVVCVCVGVCVC